MISESIKEDVVCAFGTDTPSILKRPSLIFPAEARWLDLCLTVVNAPVGVWGDRPLVTADGAPYIEPEDGLIIEDFDLWELPENQRYARTNASYATRTTGFTMVVAARTSTAALAKTYQQAIAQMPRSFGEFEFDVCIGLLDQWIDELGWAYVPLNSPNDLGLFVSVQDQHVRALEELLLSADVDIVVRCDR